MKRSGGNKSPTPFFCLYITLQNLEVYRNLLLHHRDPFDRTIIAQAQCHNSSIISKDENFKKYDIDLVWE
ncbi:PIN domain-containing protein [Synechocystis salina LEGE 06155]|nr:PIN domain-containing protein [Synechocystis salina LEGE 06155]